MRRAVASSASERSCSGRTLIECKRASAPCATKRSQERATSAATCAWAAPTVCTSSPRLTVNDSQPTTAAGTTPTIASTVKILLRNLIGRGASQPTSIGPRAQCQQGNGGCESAGKSAHPPTSTALRVARHPHELLQLLLDLLHLRRGAACGAAQRPHLVEQRLRREQHLAPGGLGGHEPGEQVQRAPAQVGSRVVHAR